MFIRPLLGKIQGHKIYLSYYGPNDPLYPFPLRHDVALKILTGIILIRSMI